MPIGFSVIAAAFVLFGLGHYLARVTRPSNRKARARRIADMHPSLPRSLSIQFGCDLPGVRVGRFSLKGLRVHARSFFRSSKKHMATGGNTK